MEEHVKDAILVNEFHDLVLLRLVEITVALDHSGRPLFSSVLEEPVFYRKYFQVWVHEALEERKKMASQEDNIFE